MLFYVLQSEAMARTYLDGHYTLKEVGKYFGVSYATVSRSVKKWNVICNTCP